MAHIIYMHIKYLAFPTLGFPFQRLEWNYKRKASYSTLSGRYHRWTAPEEWPQKHHHRLVSVFVRWLFYFLPWDSSALFTTMDGRNMFVFFSKDQTVANQRWSMTTKLLVLFVFRYPTKFEPTSVFKVWAVIECLWWMWLWQVSFTIRYN